MRKFLFHTFLVCSLLCMLVSCENENAVIHNHVYDREVTAAEYLKTEATCTDAAVYYYSCACGEKSGDTFTAGEATGHVYDREVAAAEYLKAEATCTSAAAYYYSCECGAKGTATFTIGSPTAHRYTSSVVEATCNSEGYTLYTCKCGDSYKDNVKPQTYDHAFEKGRVTLSNGWNIEAYICKNCSLEALAWGTADGSMPGGKNKVYYYVTGDYVNRKDYEIVIYGKGNMPNLIRNEYPMWYDYLISPKKIIIADGVTSIGSYNFYHPNNKTKVEYCISDTVTTIKADALQLKADEIVLGRGVRVIESSGIAYDKVKTVYLPKSLEYIYSLSLRSVYFYEGTIEQLYAIKTGPSYRPSTLGSYFESIFAEYQSTFYFYVNAEDINDRRDPLSNYKPEN